MNMEQPVPPCLSCVSGRLPPLTTQPTSPVFSLHPNSLISGLDPTPDIWAHAEDGCSACWTAAQEVEQSPGSSPCHMFTSLGRTLHPRLPLVGQVIPNVTYFYCLLSLLRLLIETQTVFRQAGKD